MAIWCNMFSWCSIDLRVGAAHLWEDATSALGPEGPTALRWTPRLDRNRGDLRENPTLFRRPSRTPGRNVRFGSTRAVGSSRDERPQWVESCQSASPAPAREADVLPMSWVGRNRNGSFQVCKSRSCLPRFAKWVASVRDCIDLDQCRSPRGIGRVRRGVPPCSHPMMAVEGDGPGLVRPSVVQQPVSRVLVDRLKQREGRI